MEKMDEPSVNLVRAVLEAEIEGLVARFYDATGRQIKHIKLAHQPPVRLSETLHTKQFIKVEVNIY